MKKLIIIAVAVFFSFNIKAQVDDKFPCHIPKSKIHKADFFKKRSKPTCFFDSLSFFRDDYQDFEHPFQTQKIYYLNESDSVDRIDHWDNDFFTPGKFTLKHQTTYKYYDSELGDNHSFIEQVYNDINNENSVPFSRWIYEFDENDILLSYGLELYSIDELAWKKNRKYIISYNESQMVERLDVYTGENWDEKLHYEKYTYTEDNHTETITRIDDTGNSELNLYKQTYEYDDNKLLVKLIKEKGAGSSWSYEGSRTFAYDDNQNIVEEVADNGFKFEYIYDNNIDIKDVTGPFTEELLGLHIMEFAKHPVVKLKSYLDQLDAVTLSTIMVFHYRVVEGGGNGDETAVEENSKADNLTIYPNPTADVLTFSKDVKNVTIYNVLGAKIMFAENTNSIDISKLQSGVYVAEFELVDGAKITKQVIKK